MRNFETENRTQDQIQSNELDINELLGIDNWTMAVQGFPDPFIVSCFISDTILFIALYYNYTDTHYHFMYNLLKRQVVGKIVDFKLDSNQKNFPYKSFYNDVLNEIYVFYR